MKTLCKQCDECIEYSYKRTKRGGNSFKFFYCEGNRNTVRKYKYGTNHWHVKIIGDFKKGSYSEKAGKQLSAQFKQDKNNYIRFIDDDKTNLMLKNLREVSLSCMTQEMNNKEGYTGISKVNNKYQAHIEINKKTIHIGTYNTRFEAYHAYILKCEAIGRKINKETTSYKRYIKYYENIYKKPKSNLITDFKGLNKTKHGYSVFVHHNKEKHYVGHFKNKMEGFHAYVLGCKKLGKKINIDFSKYDKYLKKENPPDDLGEFKEFVN